MFVYNLSYFKRVYSYDIEKFSDVIDGCIF